MIWPFDGDHYNLYCKPENWLHPDKDEFVGTGGTFEVTTTADFVNNLRERLAEHTEEAWICCPETCFCWDVQEWLDEYDGKDPEE